MEQATFWQKNKVFIIGLLAAITQALLTIYKDPETNIMVPSLIYALVVAVLTYFARNWRGDKNSILGILVAGGGVAANLLLEGYEWSAPLFYIQLVAQLIRLYQDLENPDAKSVGYEYAPGTLRNKIDGEKLVEAPLTSGHVKELAAAEKAQGMSTVVSTPAPPVGGQPTVTVTR